MTDLCGNWNYPTIVRFGAGRIAELSETCRELEISRPLLVTDRGLATNPIVLEALDALRDGGLDVELFADVIGDPTDENVERGCDILRAHDGDGVIAFGGGSSLDAGKAIALVAFQSEALWAFEDVGGNFRRADVSRILPVIAVPTTAGTGSEVGRASVIKDRAAKVKRIIFHPLMLPKVVIADPALTVGLPPALTAAVGMDALSHNLEAFFAPGYHPFARGIATEGARLVKDWLPIAVREPGNIEARAHMLAASQAGATAFQRGLGAMHALAHPLGAFYGVHHGLLNAILMPYVLAANSPTIDEDGAYLARCLGLGDRGRDLLDWTCALRREIGIPNTLTEAGVPSDDIDTIARMAIEDGSAATNPVPFDRRDYVRVLEMAFSGDFHVRS